MAATSRKCGLCREAQDAHDGMLGPLIGPVKTSAQSASCYVHRECALWAPEVYYKNVRGVDVLKNLSNAVRRCRSIKCTRCGEKGATAGCQEEKCPASYHFWCATQESCLFIPNKFFMVCPKHANLAKYKNLPGATLSRTARDAAARQEAAAAGQTAAREARQGGRKRSGRATAGAGAGERGGKRVRLDEDAVRDHLAAAERALKALDDPSGDGPDSLGPDGNAGTYDADEAKWRHKQAVRLIRHRARLAPVVLAGTGGMDGAQRYIARTGIANAKVWVGTEVAGFEALGGLPHVVTSLKEVALLPLLHQDLLKQMAIQAPRGILLHGAPGSGKTSAVRALAAECARSAPRPVCLFVRKGADCLGKYVGDAERTLRLLFQEATLRAPSIIFLDELDALAPARSIRESTQDQVHASVVSTLLSLMDGLSDRGQVVVIAATNRPDTLDPALRRPGRFDREITFGLPDTQAREDILRCLTREWPVVPDAGLLRRVAQATTGFAGADLQALCCGAVLSAARRTAADDLLTPPPTQPQSDTQQQGRPASQHTSQHQPHSAPLQTNGGPRASDRVACQVPASPNQGDQDMADATIGEPEGEHNHGEGAGAGPAARVSVSVATGDVPLPAQGTVAAAMGKGQQNADPAARLSTSGEATILGQGLNHGIGKPGREDPDPKPRGFLGALSMQLSSWTHKKRAPLPTPTHDVPTPRNAAGAADPGAAADAGVAAAPSGTHAAAAELPAQAAADAVADADAAAMQQEEEEAGAGLADVGGGALAAECGQGGGSMGPEWQSRVCVEECDWWGALEGAAAPASLREPASLLAPDPAAANITATAQPPHAPSAVTTTVGSPQAAPSGSGRGDAGDTSCVLEEWLMSQGVIERPVGVVGTSDGVAHTHTVPSPHTMPSTEVAPPTDAGPSAVPAPSTGQAVALATTQQPMQASVGQYVVADHTMRCLRPGVPSTASGWLLVTDTADTDADMLLHAAAACLSGCQVVHCTLPRLVVLGDGDPAVGLTVCLQQAQTARATVSQDRGQGEYRGHGGLHGGGAPLVLLLPSVQTWAVEVVHHEYDNNTSLQEHPTTPAMTCTRTQHSGDVSESESDLEGVSVDVTQLWTFFMQAVAEVSLRLGPLLVLATTSLPEEVLPDPLLSAFHHTRPTNNTHQPTNTTNQQGAGGGARMQQGQQTVVPWAPAGKAARAVACEHAAADAVRSQLVPALETLLLSHAREVLAMQQPVQQVKQDTGYVDMSGENDAEVVGGTARGACSEQGVGGVRVQGMGQVVQAGQEGQEVTGGRYLAQEQAYLQSTARWLWGQPCVGTLSRQLRPAPTLEKLPARVNNAGQDILKLLRCAAERSVGSTVRWRDFTKALLVDIAILRQHATTQGGTQGGKGGKAGPTGPRAGQARSAAPPPGEPARLSRASLIGSAATAIQDWLETASAAAQSQVWWTESQQEAQDAPAARRKDASAPTAAAAARDANAAPQAGGHPHATNPMPPSPCGDPALTHEPAALHADVAALCAQLARDAAASLQATVQQRVATALSANSANTVATAAHGTQPTGHGHNRLYDAMDRHQGPDMSTAGFTAIVSAAVQAILREWVGAEAAGRVAKHGTAADAGGVLAGALGIGHAEGGEQLLAHAVRAECQRLVMLAKQA